MRTLKTINNVALKVETDRDNTDDKDLPPSMVLMSKTIMQPSKMRTLKDNNIVLKAKSDKENNVALKDENAI